MKVNVRGDKTNITEPMSNYALEKLQKLEKYITDNENITATVLFKQRDHKSKIEVTVPLKTIILRAEEVQKDFYAAVDIVVEKLESQLRKNKTKLQTRTRKDSSFKDFIYDHIEDLDNEEEIIVKRKRVELKPMSEEEAILQMELLGHQFFLFNEEESNAATIVYKRKDGHYGILETK